MQCRRSGAYRIFAARWPPQPYFARTKVPLRVAPEALEVFEAHRRQQRLQCPYFLSEAEVQRLGLSLRPKATPIRVSLLLVSQYYNVSALMQMSSLVAAFEKNFDAAGDKRHWLWKKSSWQPIPCQAETAALERHMRPTDARLWVTSRSIPLELPTKSRPLVVEFTKEETLYSVEQLMPNKVVFSYRFHYFADRGDKVVFPIDLMAGTEGNQGPKYISDTPTAFCDGDRSSMTTVNTFLDKRDLRHYFCWVPLSMISSDDKFRLADNATILPLQRHSHITTVCLDDADVVTNKQSMLLAFPLPREWETTKAASVAVFTHREWKIVAASDISVNFGHVATEQCVGKTFVDLTDATLLGLLHNNAVSIVRSVVESAAPIPPGALLHDLMSPPASTSDHVPEMEGSSNTHDGTYQPTKLGADTQSASCGTNLDLEDMEEDEKETDVTQFTSEAFLKQRLASRPSLLSADFREGIMREAQRGISETERSRIHQLLLPTPALSMSVRGKYTRSDYGLFYFHIIARIPCVNAADIKPFLDTTAVAEPMTGISSHTLIVAS